MNVEDGSEPDDTCSNVEISDEKANDPFEAGKSLEGFCWDGKLVSSFSKGLPIGG
jgi:hypothetical protein